MYIYPHTPYVYLIGWSSLDRYYIGVKFAAGCHPKDFWVDYFCSSVIVDAFREEHGEPDIIQIRKTFLSSCAAREYESKILRRMDAKHHPKLLNGSNGGQERFDPSAPKSAKWKYSMVKKHAEKNWPEGYCNVHGCSCCGKLIDSRKKFCSNQCSNTVNNKARALPQTRTCEHCGDSFITYPKASQRFCSKKCVALWRGSKEEFKRRGPRPEMRGPKPRIECPHCGKQGAANTMYRWHFNNCKLKADHASLVPSSSENVDILSDG